MACLTLRRQRCLCQQAGLQLQSFAGKQAKIVPLGNRLVLGTLVGRYASTTISPATSRTGYVRTA